MKENFYFFTKGEWISSLFRTKNPLGLEGNKVYEFRIDPQYRKRIIHKEGDHSWEDIERIYEEAIVYLSLEELMQFKEAIDGAIHSLKKDSEQPLIKELP